MRKCLLSCLIAVGVVSLLGAQAPNSGSDEQAKAGKAAAADDTQGAKAETTKGLPRSGAAPAAPARGFRSGPPDFPPGARGGFVPRSPATTTRVTEPAERPGLSQPRPMGPLPADAAAGKSLLLDVCFAQTKDARTQPSAAELLEMQRDGKLESNSRVRLLMLENLPAFAQFGALVNKVSGVTATNVRTLPIYTAVNVGTIVQATGRMEDDGTIVLQVYVEKSELTPSDEPPETRKPEDITRLLSQSTVRLKAGEAVVLSSGPDGGSDAKSQTWIVLSCQTL